MEIRLATEHDAAQIQAIYTPIVTETVISFEVDPPTVADIQARLAETLTCFPWLVCEHQAQVLGYAYASKHRSRAAYQWAVDVSVYVRAGVQRFGLGRALYRSLFKILALQGFYNAYAGIALPNPASVGLHEAVGFQPVGVYQAVGYKLGTWHDVGWWQLQLQDRPPRPSPPVALAVVRQVAAWADALTAGLPLIRADENLPGL